MHKLLTLIVALVMANTINAQNAKFGKPTTEEWELSSVPFAPDASAVILYKSVEVNYKLSSTFNTLGSGGDGSLDDDQFAARGTTKYVSQEGTTMEYDVKLRTKILSDAGAEYSSIDIVTFNEEDDMNMRDEFYEFNVTVFSKADGKVKKRRLAKSDIKDERIDEYYCIRHVRIPDVKAGDIIEYQYKLFSNRITYIYYTQLQEYIPVMYASCKLEIPHFLQFNINKPEIANVTATAERGNILIQNPGSSYETPRKCATNVFNIQGRYFTPYNGEINVNNITSGKVQTVRTELNDSRYDIKPEIHGFVRHLIIGK